MPLKDITSVQLRANRLILALSLLVIAILIGFEQTRAYQRIVEQEKERLQQSTEVVAINLGRRLQISDDTLQAILADLETLWQQPAGIPMLHQLLQSMRTSTLGIEHLLVIDAQGIVISSTHSAHIGQPFEHPELLQTLRQTQDANALHILPPFRDARHRWVNSLGKTRHDAQGRFQGVVLALLNDEYFGVLIDSLRSKPDMRAGLIHDNGQVMYLTPDHEAITGQQADDVNLPFYRRHLASDHEIDFYLGPSLAEPLRLIVTRNIRPSRGASDHPLILALGRDVPTLFHGWRHEVLIRFGLFLIIAVLSTLGLNQYQRKQRAYLKLNAIQEAKRQQAEQRLRTAEERWRLALDGAGHGLWDWNVATGVVVFSHTWKTMLGYEDSEIGADVNEWVRLVHPDDLDKTIAAVQAYLKGDTPIYADIHRLRCKDGSWRWILDRGSTFERDAQGQVIRMLGTHTDVTPQILAEERLRIAADGANLGFWYWNLDSGITEWSVHCKQHLGLPQDQQESIAYFRDALHPDDRDHVFAAMQRAIERHKDYAEEYRIVHPDGSVHWIAALGRVDFDSTGKALSMSGITLDITARKHTEQALYESEARMRHFNSELESQVKQRTAELAAANDAKNKFLSNMSHEVRTPLNTIQALTGVLLEQQPTAHQRDLLTRIETASGLLLGILNDLLDYAKIEAHQLQIERLPMRWRDILDKCRSLFEIQAQLKQLSLQFTLDEQLHTVVLGDSLRLLQILNNLIGNALKFTERGSVQVDVSCLEKQAQQVKVKVTVCDTGIGLSKEQQARLFVAFQQADASTTRRYGGTGLGLSICKRLIELMDGEIGLESHEGQGSCFWIILDMPLVAHATEEAVQEPLIPVATDTQQRPCKPVDIDTVRPIVQELLTLLSHGDVRARTHHRELESLLADTPLQQDYAPIAMAMTRFDYPYALELLIQLAQRHHWNLS